MTNTRTTGPGDAKAAARARIRSDRASLSASRRATAADGIAEAAATLLPAGPARITCYVSMPTEPGITCYVSMPTEPGTELLIADALLAGHEILVPRIRGAELDWVRLLASSTFAAGPLGIREPVGEPVDPTVLGSMDVMFVPGLAIDRSGRRLGQGGGYYDRVLAGVPSHADGGPLLAAVLFDDEILDEIPVEPHDCRVDAAVTPGGVFWVG
jgi:5-formyltetrahydrofolate cyclo-ligase